MKIQDMTQNEKSDLLTTLWNDPAVTLHRHNIALSRMELDRATSAVYFLRANRVEREV